MDQRRIFPGLNSDRRLIRWLAGGYWAFVLLAVVGAMADGAEGVPLGLLYGVFLALPAFAYGHRRSLPLLGAEGTLPKAAGWIGVVAVWGLVGGMASALGDATMSAPQEQDGGLAARARTVGSGRITPEDGGRIELAHPELEGAVVSLAPGAVSDPMDVEVGVVPDPPPLDGADLVRSLLPEDRGVPATSVLPPPMVALAAEDPELRPVGPLLSLSPSGTEFAAPVSIEVPRRLLARAADGTGTSVVGLLGRETPQGVTWEVVAPTAVDDNTVRFEVRHFSLFWFIASRFIGTVVAERMTLPQVPTFTDAFVSRMVCSGIEPRIDTGRMPSSTDLIIYLMNPVTPGSMGYWASVRDVPDWEVDYDGYLKRMEELHLRNGSEDVLENWLIGQPKGSVSVTDLFGKAYELAQGDYFQAMLLSHNALRGLTYGANFGNRQDPLIQRRMTPILEYGDAVGHRYHLFGMMLFGFRHAAGIQVAPDEQNFDWRSDAARDWIVHVEEAFVSGDIITEPEEAAIDKEGFHVGQDFVHHVFNHSRDELISSPHLTLEACGTLDVTAAADKTDVRMGDQVYFTSQVADGEQPYVYHWRFGDGGESLLSSGSHGYDTAGTFEVALQVTDANGLEGEAHLSVTVADTLVGDYVAYYMDNVRCWDAPRLYVGARSAFEAEEKTCDIPGGGRDCSVQVKKVELQSGFKKMEDANVWACLQISSRVSHYWCGTHLMIGDTQYWNGNLDCNWDEIPTE